MNVEKKFFIRLLEDGSVSYTHLLRDYTEDKYRRVDDYPFGGFAGMVMKIEPIERCINALKAEREYDEVIFTTPDGEQFNQPMANTPVSYTHLDVYKRQVLRLKKGNLGCKFLI